MAALGDVLALSGAAVREVAPLAECKVLKVKLPNTVDSSDTFTLDLSKFGCTNIDWIIGCRSSTEGSVVVTDAPTTSVTTSTLTVTLDGSGNNQVRTYMISMY